jgi:hypothetical protein
VNARTKHALALLEAANPVPDVPPLPPPRRPVRAVAVVGAVAAAVAIAIVAPADDDVVARAADALRGDQTVFIDARKIEYGKVVTREKTWTSANRRRVETYLPDGRLESVIVATPDRVKLTRADGTVQVFPGARIPTEFEGDPLMLLTLARDGEDGFELVGEDVFRGQRVFLIDVRREIGPVRIAISAETYLPVYSKMGLSTYVYDRVEVTERPPGP